MKHRDILYLLGGAAKVARETGTNKNTVAAWYRRNSIPTGFWRMLLSYAEQNGVDLTVEDFVPHQTKGATE